MYRCCRDLRGCVASVDPLDGGGRSRALARSDRARVASTACWTVSATARHRRAALLWFFDSVAVRLQQQPLPGEDCVAHVSSSRELVLRRALARCDGVRRCEAHAELEPPLSSHDSQIRLAYNNQRAAR